MKRYIKSILLGSISRTDWQPHQLAAQFEALRQIYARILGRTLLSGWHHYPFYKHLPTQANRDITQFSQEWDELLVKTCDVAEEVCQSRYQTPILTNGQ